MKSPSRVGGIALFCAKFSVLSAVFLFLWWWKVQPLYVGFVGQISSAILRFIARIPIEAMRVEVDPAGVLSTETILVYVLDRRSYPIEIAYLVANIPPYFALVLATGGLGIKRTLTVLGIGLAVLIAGHATFLVLVFVFSRQIQEAPEVPTAIGLFLLTLPFILWIVLAYWDRLGTLFEEAEEDDGEQKDPPSETAGP